MRSSIDNITQPDEVTADEQLPVNNDLIIIIDDASDILDAPAPDAPPPLPTIDNADDPDSTESSKPPTPLSHRLFLLIPVITATLQASQTVKDLENANASYAMQILLPSLSFINSIGFSKKFTIRSIDKIIQMKNTGKLPKNWPILTSKKEALALGATGLITCYIVFSNAVQCYDYIQSFPAANHIQDRINEQGWTALTLFFSATIGVNVVVSQGFEVYETLRERLAGKPIAFANIKSGIASMVIGLPLALLSTSNAYFSNHTAIVDYFSLNDSYTINTIRTLSLTTAIGDFCMNGRYRIQTLDKLVGYLSNERPGPDAVLAVLASGAFAGFLSYHLRIINESAIKLILQTLIDAPDVIPTLALILSYGLAVDDLISSTASLTPLTQAALSWMGTQVSSLYHRITDNCRQPEEIPDEEKPFLADYAANPNLLFSRSSNEEMPVPPKNAHKCSPCVIL